jgi:large subunit ribosomal protein L31
MKSDVHPDYNPVIFKDGDDEIRTRSTITSSQTREVDGVEHYVVNVDISAFSHPFYTGQKKLVDTEGRVDRFMKRYNMNDDEDADEEAAEEDKEEAASEETSSDDEDADEE